MVNRNVSFTKRDQAVPIYQLVHGDSKTSGIVINVSRYDGKCDLSTLGWSVNINNAKGVSDIVMFNPVVTDMWLTYDFTFPAIVASEVGNTVIQLEAVNSAGAKVWKSGKRYISVIEGITATAGYDEDDLSVFQQTVSTVGAEVRAMSTAMNGYETRIANAVQTAGNAATAASQAAANTNAAIANANAVAAAIAQKAANGEFNGAAGAAGQNGANGQDGYTPVKGIDYFDGADGADWIPTENELNSIAQSAANRLQPTITEISGSLSAISQKCDSATTSIATLQGQVAGKQDIISDIETIRSGAALGATALQTHQDISGKQDVIADLDTIRSGAGAGATALQPSVFELIETITLTEDTKKIERTNLGLKRIVIFASNIVVKNGSTQVSGTFGISSLNNGAVKNIAFGGNTLSSATVKNVIDLRVEGGLLFGTTYDTITDDYKSSYSKTPNALAEPKSVTSIDYIALSQWNGYNFAEGCVFKIYGVRA